VIAALVAGDTVGNVVVLEDGTHLTAELAGELAGDLLVAVPAGTPVGPGWGYDEQQDPPFVEPLAPEPPSPPEPEQDPAAAVLPILGAIAADPDRTLEQKLAALVDVLAASAPAAPPGAATHPTPAGPPASAPPA
jgi:hypothetical protein